MKGKQTGLLGPWWGIKYSKYVSDPTGFYVNRRRVVLTQDITVQLPICTDGVTQVYLLLLIFKGIRLRISVKERKQYDSRVVVEFQ